MHSRNEIFNNLKHAYKTHTKCIKQTYAFLVWNLQNSKMHMKFIRNAYEMHVGFSLFFTFSRFKSFVVATKWVSYQTYLWIEIYLSTPLQVSIHSHMGHLSDLLVNWNLLENSTSRVQSFTNGSAIRLPCEYKFTWALKWTWATSTNYKYNNHKYQSQVAVWMGYSQVVKTGSNQK